MKRVSTQPWGIQKVCPRAASWEDSFKGYGVKQLTAAVDITPTAQTSRLPLGITQPFFEAASSASEWHGYRREPLAASDRSDGIAMGSGLARKIANVCTFPCRHARKEDVKGTNDTREHVMLCQGSSRVRNTHSSYSPIGQRDSEALRRPAGNV